MDPGKLLLGRPEQARLALTAGVYGGNRRPSAK
jgi:hypothetical protein